MGGGNELGDTVVGDEGPGHCKDEGPDNGGKGLCLVGTALALSPFLNNSAIRSLRLDLSCAARILISVTSSSGRSSVVRIFMF